MHCVCSYVCSRLQAAKKAKAEPKAKGKASAKQQAKINEKRFTFDVNNIPGAVENALKTEYADMSSTQKRLITRDGKNLAQALTAGYEYTASMGRNMVEEGFFTQYRRIYSVGQSDSLSSTGPMSGRAGGELAPAVQVPCAAGGAQDSLALTCASLVELSISWSHETCSRHSLTHLCETTTMHVTQYTMHETW